MTVFERQIALARRMIAKNGMAVQWQSRGPLNVGGTPAKPSGASDPVLTPVKIVFLPAKQESLAGLFSMFSQDVPDVPTSGVRGLMASTVGLEPSVNDLVIRKPGDVLHLDLKRGIDVLAPDGEPILYFLRFTK